MGGDIGLTKKIVIIYLVLSSIIGSLLGVYYYNRLTKSGLGPGFLTMVGLPSDPSTSFLVMLYVGVLVLAAIGSVVSYFILFKPTFIDGNKRYIRQWIGLSILIILVEGGTMLSSGKYIKLVEIIPVIILVILLYWKLKSLPADASSGTPGLVQEQTGYRKYISKNELIFILVVIVLIIILITYLMLFVAS